MVVVELLKRKRDGQRLSADEIAWLISEYTNGGIPDYQMAAMLMAVFFRGLSRDELLAWTRAMLDSGDTMDLSTVDGPKVDKHSTGGVGDKISIPLAPLVASCGVRVPMISGRGLGHTGGTLDKLESIPGLRTDLSPERFVQGVKEVGVCMIGQTERLAPADKLIYALRDVTATVDSVELISASIMSKKLAEGIGGLVLDVKVGSGAFMKTLEDARRLATTMVNIGNDYGVRTEALITDMDQPIGWAVGNALEIQESVEVLQGRGPERTTELVVKLGGTMLVLGGVASSRQEGEDAIRKAMLDGSGLERFQQMVAFQGGDPRVADDPTVLPTAEHKKDFYLEEEGFLRAIDCEKVGMAAVVLGGGRLRKEDQIDPSVGFRFHAGLGDRVGPKTPVLTIHYNDHSRLERAVAMLAEAFVVGDGPVCPRPLVVERVM